MEILKNWTEEQKAAYKRAQVAGYFSELAKLKGDKGSLRKPLSDKEKARRKVKQQMVKQSRKANRA